MIVTTIVNGYYNPQTELGGDHIVALQLPNVPNDHRATSSWYHTNLLHYFMYILCVVSLILVGVKDHSLVMMFPHLFLVQ